MATRERPVLVYDGDCGFCTSSVGVARRLPSDAAIVAWQHADLAGLGLTAQQANQSVQWVGTDGDVRSGHEAVAALLSRCGAPWSWLGQAMLLPGLSWLAARTYHLVSANRHRLPGGTPACALPPEQRPR